MAPEQGMPPPPPPPGVELEGRREGEERSSSPSGMEGQEGGHRSRAGWGHMWVGVVRPLW